MATKKDAGMTPEEMIETIGNMSVLDVKKLVEMMEEHFGVTAAQPVAVAGLAAAADESPAAEEQTEFTVMLTSFGEKKIEVIKKIRSITSLTLQEAKKLVEDAPSVVKENVSKEEADKVKEELDAAGASVEIK